ncbi:uncharacterized protein BKA78DRAFT_311285 [Phyllosticta capitalensis]|uniref:CCHC-type domain-containing protein n=1 Tax=Phyllosticta capitalensis TaxID=121624 RepID=A0ABR1YW05_9PEZI
MVTAREIDSYRPSSSSRSRSGKATPSSRDEVDEDSWRRGDYVRGESMRRTPSTPEDRDPRRLKDNGGKDGADYNHHDVQKKWKARQTASLKTHTEGPAPKSVIPSGPKNWPNLDIWRTDCPRCGGKRHTAIAQQCTRICRLCGTSSHIGSRCPKNPDQRRSRVSSSSGTSSHGQNHHHSHSNSSKGKDDQEKKAIKPTLVETRHDEGAKGTGPDEPWKGFSLGKGSKQAAKPALIGAKPKEGAHRETKDHGSRSTASRRDSVYERGDLFADKRISGAARDGRDRANRLTPVDFGRDRMSSLDHHHRSREAPYRSSADRHAAYHRDEERSSAAYDLRDRNEKLFSQNLTLLRDRELLRRQVEMMEMEKTRPATGGFDPSFWMQQQLQMQMAELEKMRSAGFDNMSSLRQLETAESDKRLSSNSDATSQLRADMEGERRPGGLDNQLLLRQMEMMAEMQKRMMSNSSDDPEADKMRPGNLDPSFPMMSMPLSMPYGINPLQYQPLQMQRSWLPGFGFPM